MSTQAQTGTVTSQPPIQKFSRYRSVRKAASQQIRGTPPSLPAYAPVESAWPRGLGRRRSDLQTTLEKQADVRPISSHSASLAALEGREYRPDPSHTTQPVSQSMRSRGESRTAAQTTETRAQGGLAQGERETRRRVKDVEHQSRSKRGESRRRHDVAPKEQTPEAGHRVPLPDSTPVDAPVSAVNAGDRKVTVLWEDEVTELIINPDTTARQLIAAAAVRLSHPNEANLILLESFSQLGLERPVRQYEHIRDIMNSWDRDDLNALVVKKRAEGSRASGLTISSSPPLRPDSRSVKMYYSQRPGKWDKRFVTLRGDGQIVIAKKEGAESVNVCHISDFDIYIPTERQISKKIKPPRKCCLAVKSQQKSAVFLDGATYVHFFSTSDEDLANVWYDAIQSWRSWYLVDIYGLAEQPKRSQTTKQKHPVEVDTLAPLLDRVNLSNPTLGRSKTTKTTRLPPSAFPRGLLNTVPIAETSAESSDEATFAPNSLLGRSNSVRAKTGRSADSIRPSTRHQSDPQKPLVDLTPTFREPPQHQRKGHGVAPIPGKFLVENATNREVPLPGAINLPDTTAFRRGDTVASSSVPPATGVLQRGQSVKRRPSTRGNPKATSGSPSSHHNNLLNEEPFIPNSLLTSSSKLAHTGQSGNATTGHGIASYTADTEDWDWDKPLVDLNLKSKFNDGSLLRRLESTRDPSRPVNDRS